MEHISEKGMGRSWLIQRLERPWGKPSILGADNPFSFGGGLHNGGLSSEAMDLLRGIFRFDYMGASEFEWGAVPEVLTRIAKNVNRYQRHVLTFPLAEVAKHWKDKSKNSPPGDATVYVICPWDWRDEVFARIRGWAAKDGDYESGVPLKERVCLAAALRPMDDFDRERCGWLELDNGFFFFTDEAMFEATADLFGIPLASDRPTDG